jgi:hypothetical protein
MHEAIHHPECMNRRRPAGFAILLLPCPTRNLPPEIAAITLG